MKNIQSRQEFLLIKEQQLNEGLMGFLKGIFKSIGKLYDKIKGGKELKAKIEEYKEKINKIFQGLTSAEQTKTAVNKNVQAAVESKLYEEEMAGADVSTAQAKGEDVKPEPIDQEQTAQGGEENLDKTQLKGKINNSKEHLKQLQKSFSNEIDVLKRRFTGKDGKVPKKLEYSLALAKNQLSDYIYEKWEEHYTQIGDKKTIANIQKQRAIVAKEMKTNTEALQKLIEGGDKEKMTFEVDRKYKYTDSEGNVKTITVKEVDENGDVTKAVTRKGKEINPYTDNIGEYYQEGETYEYTNKEGKQIEVTITQILDGGNIQVKSNGATFVPITKNLGYKVEKNPQTQAQPKQQAPK